MVLVCLRRVASTLASGRGVRGEDNIDSDNGGSGSSSSSSSSSCSNNNDNNDNDRVG